MEGWRIFVLYYMFELITYYFCYITVTSFQRFEYSTSRKCLIGGVTFKHSCGIAHQREGLAALTELTGAINTVMRSNKFNGLRAACDFASLRPLTKYDEQAQCFEGKRGEAPVPRVLAARDKVETPSPAADSTSNIGNGFFSLAGRGWSVAPPASCPIRLYFVRSM